MNDVVISLSSLSHSLPPSLPLPSSLSPPGDSYRTDSYQADSYRGEGSPGGRYRSGDQYGGRGGGGGGGEYSISRGRRMDDYDQDTPGAGGLDSFVDGR